MDGEGGAAGLSRAGWAVSPQIAGLTTIVGREDELRDLRAAFGHNRVQVLAGLGGVGKTSIARAYANRHLTDYGMRDSLDRLRDTCTRPRADRECPLLHSLEPTVDQHVPGGQS